jgi:hypothetical protein
MKFGKQIEVCLVNKVGELDKRWTSRYDTHLSQEQHDLEARRQ